MIRHYLKLMWNRRRSNVLVAVEICLSFLVVFAVITFAVYYFDNWRRPVGFSIADVWHVHIDMKAGNLEGGATKISPEIRESYRQLLAAVRELPEVTAVGAASCAPYGNSRWISGDDIGNWHLRYGVNDVTDGFASAMGIEITQGRWFDSTDDGVSWKTVVVNEHLANEIFHGANPVGKKIPQSKPTDGSPVRDMRIVGVVRDFRQNGEVPNLNEREGYLFMRHDFDDDNQRPPESVMIKVKPGTTAAFEERLTKRMQAAVRNWSFEVQPAAQMRERRINERLAPVLAFAVVAGFLMLMVGLGLTGVLWQTVTQRTREIGLRRAKGATARDIRAQIIGELFVLTSAALVVGSAIVVQFPLLQLMTFVSPGMYAISLVVSAGCIYLLTMACAWYPSGLATRVQPAEALHYE